MYTINMIAKKLGIPSVTIRAWENRYGVVKPGRTEGGHRIYSDEDLMSLSWLKEQVVERGIPISQAARMLKQRQDESLSKQPAEHAAPGTLTFAEMSNNLYQALLAFDNVRAHAYIDLAFSMYHFEDVFHHILVPVLRRVGDDWHANRVKIAQEHFVSNFAKQRILEFSRLFPVNRTLPKCVAFCPFGESHQMGLLLFALFLQKKGMEVIYLGGNTTFDDLRSIIREIDAHIICISLTDQNQLKEIVAWLDGMEAELHTKKIVLGGSGFNSVSLPYADFVLSGDVEEWERWYLETLTTIKKPSQHEKADGS